MNDFKVLKKNGQIKSFDRRTSAGSVVVGSGKPYRFWITSFRSRVPRYPEPGEAVEALFSEDGKRLIGVWSKQW